MTIDYFSVASVLSVAQTTVLIGVNPCLTESDLKKQSVRQGKLVQFSRFESCPAKVSRPAGM